VLAAEAPVVVRYLPAAQSVHEAEPRASLYFPAAHGEHVSPSALVYPAWHSQLVFRLLPLRDCEFGGQDVQDNADYVVLYKSTPQNVQATEPAVSLYDPAVHAKHSPPFAPVNPGLQRHVLESLLPLGESEFAGQDVHVLFREAPVVVRYLPGLQSVHMTEPIEPIASLYFPATHAEHDSPSAPVYPTLHLHLVHRLLPKNEIEFIGHPLHPPEPDLSLYFPARHNSHVCPSGPVAPALQVQSVRRLDLGGEFEFMGQTLQVGLPSSDHVPSEHGWHVSTSMAPSAVEYSPPAHLEHS
jgi:hypothetical protein